MQNHYVITGASRGLGEALALQLLDAGHTVTGVSRTESKRLAEAGRKQPSLLQQVCLDLANRQAVEQFAGDYFKSLDQHAVAGLTLINNAAMIQPISRVGGTPSYDEIHASLLLNLYAPMVLCEHFVKATRAWPIRKSIVNISSGAAIRPIEGWSAYCAAKAALHMYTQVAAAEQVHEKYPVRLLSFAPGIIDTSMQEAIRGARKADFPGVDRFIQYKEEGKLARAEVVAEKLLAYLGSKEFGAKVFVDCKEIG